MKEPSMHLDPDLANLLGKQDVTLALKESELDEQIAKIREQRDAIRILLQRKPESRKRSEARGGVRVERRKPGPKPRPSATPAPHSDVDPDSQTKWIDKPLDEAILELMMEHPDWKPNQYRDYLLKEGYPFDTGRPYHRVWTTLRDIRNGQALADASEDTGEESQESDE
jgi:hypothetical protein